MSLVSSAKRSREKAAVTAVGLPGSTRTRKTPRISYTNEDTAVCARACRRSTDHTDYFALIGKDCLIHVIGYLLAVAEKPVSFPTHFGFYLRDVEKQEAANDVGNPQGSPTSSSGTCHVMRYHRMSEQEKEPYKIRLRQYKAYLDGLPLTKSNVSQVSRLWRVVANDVICRAGAPPSAILGIPEFCALKHRISHLSLDEVCRQFITDVKAEWGWVDWTYWCDCECEDCVATLAGSPLSVFVDKYCEGSYDILAAICAKEYKRFLLVKCIEVLADADVGTRGTGSMWHEVCCPTELVQMFWRAHSSNPTKYHEDCNELIGRIIDDSPASCELCEEGSRDNYFSKKESLFAFEQQCPSGAYYGCRDHSKNNSIFEMWKIVFDSTTYGFNDVLGYMAEDMLCTNRS